MVISIVYALKNILIFSDKNSISSVDGIDEMALKFSQFTCSKVCSVIFNQSTYFWLRNVSRYGSCCLVRLKIDFANMFQAAEVDHAREGKEERKDGHVLVPEAGLGSVSSVCAH